jgi:hypothetical protein
LNLDLWVDSGTKLVSAGCGVATLFLAWRKILPRLDEIHTQTNSLAAKAETAAHALGVHEALIEVAAVDPATAQAARLVLEVAAKRERPPRQNEH